MSLYNHLLTILLIKLNITVGFNIIIILPSRFQLTHISNELFVNAICKK